MNNEKLFPLIKAETAYEKQALDIVCALPVCAQYNLIRVTPKYDNGVLHWRAWLNMHNLNKEMHNKAIDTLQQAHKLITAVLINTAGLKDEIKLPI